jgi:hypothetical protein
VVVVEVAREDGDEVTRAFVERVRRLPGVRIVTDRGIEHAESGVVGGDEIKDSLGAVSGGAVW